MTREDHRLTLFVMTRRHLRKAREIVANPAMSLVVPIARRVLWLLPPATIQLHGRAELLDWHDSRGTSLFESFWLGRRILDAYRASYRRGERRIYFVRVTLEPTVRRYMLGHSIWRIRRHMESGAATVVLPSTG